MFRVKFKTETEHLKYIKTSSNLCAEKKIKKHECVLIALLRIVLTKWSEEKDFICKDFTVISNDKTKSDHVKCNHCGSE